MSPLGGATLIVVKPRKNAPVRLAREALESYAHKALAARPMSEGQMRTKLLAKAENPADVDPLLAKLREYGALNDQAFAAQFGALRKQNRSFGAQRVRQELRHRQIDPGLAQETVARLFAAEDERVLIDRFLARKFRGKNLAEWLADPKHFASAFRRLRTAGYSAAHSLAALQHHSKGAVTDLPDADFATDSE